MESLYSQCLGKKQCILQESAIMVVIGRGLGEDFTTRVTMMSLELLACIQGKTKDILT